jgi:hypothetical protein
MHAVSEPAVALLAGLGGALIGAAAAILNQRQANKHARDTDRRHEKVELVAQFWAAADRLWRAAESLAVDIISLSNAQGSANDESIRVYTQRWRESLSRRDTAGTEAAFLVAQMRLLYPGIADDAEALRSASSTFELEHHDAHRAAHQSALESFEGAAQRLLRE